MGMMLGTLTLVLLFAVPLTPMTFLVAVTTSGIYFWAMLVAQYFPGDVAWADPEFDPILKRFFGMPQQKFVSLAVTAVLIAAAILMLRS